MRPMAIPESEIAQFNLEQQFLKLQQDTAYNRVLEILREAIALAERDMRTNPNPRMDSHYLNRWRERKAMYEFQVDYVDGVVNHRRARLKQLLVEIGFSEDVAEHRKDESTEFLNSFFGGPNGNTSTSTTAE